MRQHQKLWPPSFRRGAYWVQVTGYRLLGALGGDKAPPEAFWIEVLPYLGRDGFLPTAASEPEYIRPPPCTMCGAVVDRKTGRSTRACTGCWAVRYCSRKCMKLHWKEHKLFCPAAKEEQEAHNALEKEEEERSAS